jgi:hypothetical protein
MIRRPPLPSAFLPPSSGARPAPIARAEVCSVQPEPLHSSHSVRAAELPPRRRAATTAAPCESAAPLRPSRTRKQGWREEGASSGRRGVGARPGPHSGPCGPDDSGSASAQAHGLGGAPHRGHAAGQGRTPAAALRRSQHTSAGIGLGPRAAGRGPEEGERPLSQKRVRGSDRGRERGLGRDQGSGARGNVSDPVTLEEAGGDGGCRRHPPQERGRALRERGECGCLEPWDPARPGPVSELTRNASPPAGRARWKFL